MAGGHPDLDYLEAAGLELEVLAGARPGRRGLEAALDALDAAERRAAVEGPFDFLGLALPARLALHRGTLLLALDRPAEAARAFEAVLALEPSNPAAGAGRAEALLGQGRAAEALGSPGEARLFLARVPAGLPPRHQAALVALRARLGPPREQAP